MRGVSNKHCLLTFFIFFNTRHEDSYEQMSYFFSSKDHEVLKGELCDRSLSVTFFFTIATRSFYSSELIA